MFELERERVILHIPQEERGQYRNALGSSSLWALSLSCKRSLHLTSRQKGVDQPQAFITKTQMAELVTCLQKLFTEGKMSHRD